MKIVRVYQILDFVSESVISTFIAPNDKFAIREFRRFLTDPKIKDSIDPSDFSLVCSDSLDICESANDWTNDSIAVVFSGDMAVDSVCMKAVEEFKDEA